MRGTCGRLARPDSQVVALLGDGAAGFSLMDADTLVRHGLPVVMVVGSNGIWGLEKYPMQALYGGWDVAADLQPGLRYDDVVCALGGAGEKTVEQAAELDRPSTARSRAAFRTSQRPPRPLRGLPSDHAPRLTGLRRPPGTAQLRSPRLLPDELVQQDGRRVAEETKKTP